MGTIGDGDPRWTHLIEAEEAARSQPEDGAPVNQECHIGSLAGCHR